MRFQSFLETRDINQPTHHSGGEIQIFLLPIVILTRVNEKRREGDSLTDPKSFELLLEGLIFDSH
jgi:hypothetical protein